MEMIEISNKEHEIRSRLVKKFCPFLSTTFPRVNSTNIEEELYNDIYNMGNIGNSGVIVPSDYDKDKEYLKTSIRSGIYGSDERNREEISLEKTPKNMLFEHNVNIMTFKNRGIHELLHVYHGCIRENCMMWSTRDQICRMGTRTRPSVGDVLIDEYLRKEDMDGNGKIFGVDFLIKQDGDIPFLVYNFSLDLFENDDIEDMEIINWKDFLDTLYYNDNDCYYYKDPRDPNTIRNHSCNCETAPGCPSLTTGKNWDHNDENYVPSKEWP